MKRRRPRGSGATGGFVAVDLADYGLPDLASIGEGPLPALMLEVCERAAEDYRRWERQVARTGNCCKPIRLRGRVGVVDADSGEIQEVYNTDDQPNRELLIACGSRKASECSSCSYLYRGDAYQVIVSGLRGGKGVPETVTGHPMVFVTFTAPGFGAMHAHREKNGRVLACRPRDKKKSCPHGVPLGCSVRHKADDPRVGKPLCLECFDAAGQVIWNAMAPQLWRRTTTYLPRTLAREAGMTLKEFDAAVKVRFAKVAEYQRRGAIHFHAIVRLDAAPPKDDPGRVEAPPADFDVELLKAGLAWAREAAMIDCPQLGALGRSETSIRWGAELNMRRVTTVIGELSAEVVGAYLAKYSVKDSTALGLPGSPIESDADVDQLEAPAHVRELVRAAWTLGCREGFRDLGLADHAHGLGYGGHFLTKSRRYSTTMGALRQVRRDFARNRGESEGEETAEAWSKPSDDDQVVKVAEWHYLGWGYHTMGEAYLASSAAARAREERRVAREEMTSWVA